MDLHENHENVLKMIKYALRDYQLELEVRLLNNLNNEKFLNCIKRVKGIPDIKFNGTSETLDVFFGKDNTRLEILDVENIRKYCKTDSIRGLSKLQFVNKTAVSNRVVNDYNIKFNLKRENYIQMNDPSIESDIRNWNNIEKTFRYKKRYSFKTNDDRFSFDFTVVKSSIKETVRRPPSKKQKKDIKDFMKKYVIKPEYVVDFNSWYDKLKPTDEVELIGKKYDILIPKKTFKAARVFTNPEEYEVEIEYLGNKLRSNENPELVLQDLVQNLGYVLQCVQNNYFIISEREKAFVRDQYRKIMNDYSFRAPQSITLDLHHALERNYEDYKNILSIRKGYSVTDKADGERNLLVVLENGRCYLLNRKNDIKSLGCSIPELSNSILDGEYILKDKDMNNICMFMVFDVYFHKSEDVRDRILMRSESEKTQGKIKESRLEILNNIFSDINIVNDDPQSILKISKKKFYFGDDNEYLPQITKNIEDIQKTIESGKLSNEEIKEYQNSIKNLKSDNRIFTECEKVYSKDYIYHIDGLIFTPISLAVGQPFNNDKYDVKKDYNGRWQSLLKWKPLEENSIDFMIKIKKNPSNPTEDLISYMTINDKVFEYKTLVLMVGYDPKIHTKHNSFKVMNENAVYEEKYTPVPFQPTMPYKRNIHLAYIPIKDGLLKCEDGSIIHDGSIIECRYDSYDVGFTQWIPMRVREVNKPNDFVTAINVWKTINNPITLEMIKTGKIEGSDDIYYHSSEKRKDSATKPLADFHSYIKKKIITENSNPGDKLLDLACGKAGDLNHWLDSDLKMVVGTDLSKDNLESANGACNRILNAYANNPDDLLDNILIAAADSGKNILDGSAAVDDLSKYYLDIVYGNVEESSIKNGKLKKFYKLGSVGFDIVSVQFAVHYFFKDKKTIETFLGNVSSSLKPRGKFVGTCLDGKKVFKLLKNQKIISEYKNDKLLWKIIKKYDTNLLTDDDTSLGQKIDVFFNTIGQTTSEYLVNMDYFVEKCKEYDLEIVNITSFEDLYSKSINYGEANKLTPDLMTYSFLNSYFILEKK